jgi:hypothetical protein
MRLSEIKNRTKKVEVSFDEDVVTVTYNPNYVTVDYLHELRGIGGEEDQNLDSILTPFLSVITDWDLQNDDGTVIPITIESLRTVPLNILNGILEKVTLKEELKKTK